MDLTQFHVKSARDKALQINLDNNIYGIFAEIGAGQEVARHFFRAGGAAGTIAKTISAYDMAMSDAIYGKDSGGRYVSDSRLVKMLDREFNQLVERLTSTRSPDTRFFAFADTVAAKSYKGTNDCHGWMGVKFQHVPKADPSEVILHLRMLDNQNILQQEALGVVGVNLIYACYFEHQNVDSFTQTLIDGITSQRIEINMIRVKGPAFEFMDPRIVNLELVKKGLTQAVMFGKNGEALQATDVLYKKNVMVLRGSFRPPTLLNLDMLKTGEAAFKADLPKEEKDQVVILPEISMGKLLERGQVNNSDFLARVDLLNELGYYVLITNKESFPELNQYLLPLTKKEVSYVSGVYNTEELFKERPDSTILSRLGDLFTGRTKFYIYPAEKENEINITLKNIDITSDDHPLLEYLMNNKMMKDLIPKNPKAVKIWSRKVLSMIQNGEEGWELMLPKEIIQKVKEKKLFGLG